MTHNDLNRLAIIASARTEGDVRPEDVMGLHVNDWDQWQQDIDRQMASVRAYSKSLPKRERRAIPGAGWTEHETGLPPPDEGSLVRGLLWGGLIALGLWTVLLSAAYWALKLGVWK